MLSGNSPCAAFNAPCVDNKDNESQAQTGGQADVYCGSILADRLRQTVPTNRASVHQAAKLVAALLRFSRVTAGLAESTGSLPPGL